MGDIVRRVRAGDELLANDWNTVADRINEDGQLQRRSRRRTFTGINGTGATIPSQGVATLGTAQPSPVVPVINLEQAGSGLAVAIVSTTLNGDPATVHVIDQWAPTLVLCSDATVVAGDEVGPVSGSFQVGKSGSGLLAVTDYEAGKVWVVSAKGGGGGNNVAITTTIIPARNNLTPGGPITVTKQRLDGGVLVDDGDIDIYSWVNSPSKDPLSMTDPNGQLLIFIEQDDYGIWWWTGEDCDPVSISLTEGALSTDTVIGTTPVDLPGTSISVDYAGIYTYSAGMEIEVVGIPGNQAWDVTVELYNSTDSNVLLTWEFAGAGGPITNPKGSYSVATDLAEINLGDSLILRAYRATTTGTVTAIALSGVTPVTFHQLTGPLR